MPPIVPYSAYTYDETAEKYARHDLEVIATKQGLSTTAAHLLVGAPVFDEICRLAQKLPADLIVTSTHGWTGLKHVFLGSTAERIVQHSPCPVLVSRKTKRLSRNGATNSIHTILVPTDFSDCSLRGLNYAIRFAEKFAARIVLLHAVELGYAYTSDGYAMYDISDLIKTALRDGEEQMRQFVRRVRFGRVPFETVVTTVSSIDAICSAAKSHDLDLIITSTHGRTGLSHVLIGSVAEKIVRHSPCSVLVVPSHSEMRAELLLGRTEHTVQSRRAKRLRLVPPTEPFTRKYRKVKLSPFPERRKTNKFRESHRLSSKIKTL